MDEPLVELETDKVNVEVPSPFSGTLSSIDAKEGNTVKVGAVLGIVKAGKINVDKILLLFLFLTPCRFCQNRIKLFIYNRMIIVYPFFF